MLTLSKLNKMPLKAKVVFVFMIIKGICVVAIVPLIAALSGCSSNPTPPAVTNINADENSVDAGGILLMTVEVRLSTSDQGGSDPATDPFSLLVNLPTGVSYIPQTSSLAFQGPRDPDSMGACPDGTTYLVYNFAPGEFENPYKFDEFVSDVGFRVTLQASADQQKMLADATVTSPSDPCAPFPGEEYEFKVSS
jgi:hypothetical protein